MKKYKILTIELEALDYDDVIIAETYANEDNLWDKARDIVYTFVQTVITECEDIEIKYVGDGHTMFTIKTIDSSYRIAWIEA